MAKDAAASDARSRRISASDYANMHSHVQVTGVESSLGEHLSLRGQGVDTLDSSKTRPLQPAHWLNKVDR